MSTSLFRLHSRVLLVPRCMDVGLASALRQRDTPLWSRRPPFWHTGLLPTSIASTSFAPTTVSTFVTALELTAPIVVPSVFLELPLTPTPMPPPPSWSLRLSSRREYRCLSLSPWRSLSLCPCLYPAPRPYLSLQDVLWTHSCVGLRSRWSRRPRSIKKQLLASILRWC